MWAISWPFGVHLRRSKADENEPTQGRLWKFPLWNFTWTSQWYMQRCGAHQLDDWKHEFLTSSLSIDFISEGDQYMCIENTNTHVHHVNTLNWGEKVLYRITSSGVELRMCTYMNEHCTFHVLLLFVVKQSSQSLSTAGGLHGYTHTEEETKTR